LGGGEGGGGVDAAADEFGAVVDETGVDLDEGCSGVEFGDGVGFVHDAADSDDWHGSVEGGAETGDDVGAA
jgi:hypothetical protein